MKINDKVCAYIDLLGFKNHVYKNINGALSLLCEYQNSIVIKILDGNMNPLSSYPDTHQRELAERNLISTFEYFLPCSDSIFIQSSENELFLYQLCNFLCGSFLATANTYEQPDFKDDPSKVKQNIYSSTKANGVIKKTITAYWFPVLFQGGIDIGECFPIDINSIVNKKIQKSNILLGSALIKAVELTDNIEGPCLFCTEHFGNILLSNPEMKRYIVKVDNKFEIYWPSFNFNPYDECNLQLINTFERFFRPAVKLWEAYKKEKFAYHYFSFVNLVIQGTLHFYSIKEDDYNHTKNYIIRRLTQEGLDKMFTT
jgi:hypothetical protein